MEVSLSQVSKKFNFNWIFKGVSVSVNEDSPLVILGANGSGKSTLLSLIAGASLPSEGEISWQHGGQIDENLVYKYVSMAAPYLELIEDFTLLEHIDFHFKVKSPVNGLSNEDILELSGLGKSKNKRLSYFSSGMKQRVKLCLAILSDVPLLLLDEPLSNLDSKAASWYSELMTNYTQGKTIIVCSNHQENEYFFAKESLKIEDYQL